jgi:hypothetical protein
VEEYVLNLGALVLNIGALKVYIGEHVMLMVVLKI